MDATASRASGETAAKRWLVSCDSDAEPGVAVRDYFLRLGIPAKLVSPANVALHTTAAEVELDEYVQSWKAANGARLELREAPDPTWVPPSHGGTLFRPPRLGEILTRRGLIDDEQLEHALARSRETGRLLGLVLLEDGALFEEDLARALADQLELPYVSIGRVGVNAGTLNLLPISLGRELAAIPVRLKGDAVLVAFADPTDPETLAAVRHYLPKLEVGISELSAILNAWRMAEERGGARAALSARSSSPPAVSGGRQAISRGR